MNEPEILYRVDLPGILEEKAIEYFGKDKIGTKELREKLSREDKQMVLNYLIDLYHEYGAMNQGFIHVDFF